MTGNAVGHRRIAALATTRQERALVKRAAGVQAELFYARAVDSARRERTIGRINDIGTATREAIAEGEDIVDELERGIRKNSRSAVALGGLAEEGMRGMRSQLRALAEE